MSRIAVAVLAAATCLAASAEARLLPDARAAYSLVDGLDAPGSAPELFLLDDGGGAPRVRYDRDRMVAVLLAVIPGFGAGHFWINDDGGFFTFLIVDAVCWTAFFVGPAIVGPRWPFGIILFAVKVWQAFDLIRITRGGGGDEPAILPEVRPEDARPLALPAGERPRALELPLAAFAF